MTTKPYMRIWVSSPSIERNSYVYLREHMEIPTELLWLEWHSQKLTISYFIAKYYFTIFLFVVNENITFSLHDGEIWKHLLPRNVWIRHLCLLLHSKWQNFTDLYRFVFMGLAKKSIVFSPLLFSGGQSINQSIHMNIFFALRMFREMRYRPYCFVIHHR